MGSGSKVRPPWRSVCSDRIGAMKRRILLWLCPILILFLGVGLYAVLLFDRLGGSIDVILRENYQSVLAGQQMKESSERMDSGLSFALSGEERQRAGSFQRECADLCTKVCKRNFTTSRFLGKGKSPKK